MLDKVILISKHEAWMIFTDRPPFVLSSDVDVVQMIKMMLSPLGNDSAPMTTSETLEDTQSITWPKAA